MDKKDLLLYLVTDSSMANGKLEEIVKLAVKNGVTMVQLREKELAFKEFCDRALKVKTICDKYNIPLIINDNVAVCLAVNASGVHLGSSDCDISIARQKLGNNKIIGGSCRDTYRAMLAEKAGADYLGVGAVFGTSTKLDAKPITLQTLSTIASSVSIPVVAIGGINAKNILQLKDSGIAGVAVVSAIIKAQNVATATKDMLTLAKTLI